MESEGKDEYVTDVKKNVLIPICLYLVSLLKEWEGLLVSEKNCCDSGCLSVRPLKLI